MKIAELRQKQKGELEKLLEENKKRVGELVFLMRQGKKVKNTKEVRELKKDIARILTLIK
jgi:ribosomal protein L29